MTNTNTESPQQPQPELEPPRPEPAHADPRNAAPGKPWQMWVTIGSAAVPSILSLAWTVYTIQDIVGGLLGLAVGLIVDALIVATVVIAWANPSIRTVASAIGWVGAVGAAFLLAHHHWGAEEAAFAAGPIISKLLWTLALVALTAREKAKEADDSSLTLAQRRQLAKLENEALFAEAEAKAKIRRDDAKAKAASDTTIAQIHRETEEKLARMDATETLRARKYESQERLDLLAPARPRLALGSGAYAPDDASSLDGDGMGFGGAMATARATQSPTVRTGSDQEVPGVPGGGAGPQVHPSVLEAEQNRAAVVSAFEVLSKALQRQPHIAEVARAAGVSDRAAGRHLRDAELIPPAATTE